MLGLFVHPQNVKAIKIYEERFGFEGYSQSYQDKESGIIYLGMIRKI